jgi:PhzF family phenazine biosynthesis protein
METIIYQVDAFTDQPFSGNPAGVCILPGPAEEEWMEKVAREMNLSETAFLDPHPDGYNLRWFTPACEVDLCGHATLASAHILWQTGLLKPGEMARFFTLSGLLTAEQREGWIEMDFPAEPEQPVDPPSDLAKALGAEPCYVGMNRFDYLVEVDSEETVRRASPDFGLLNKLPVRGVILTSRSSTGRYDFVSRFFAPAVGVNEDPVTGSAHCCLGPYWAGRLGKQDFLAYQASPRGGVVRVAVKGKRVMIGGQAVTVLRGEML